MVHIYIVCHYLCVLLWRVKL